MLYIPFSCWLNVHSIRYVTESVLASVSIIPTLKKNEVTKKSLKKFIDNYDEQENNLDEFNAY